eukprot:TRINITY_DN14984_c0_g5_i1.p1 TRINITY_DN14984_c0_g5~~TRINITY_DN14984_c0_g5_i1.p1  ORF type:complete len:299 (+),score=53.53 TRINITY_DN14984_c0_g5_i1:111-899(+)
MRLRPASRCCWGRSLLHGVQIIALYTFVLGTCGVLSFFGRVASASDANSDLLAVECLQNVVHSLGIYAGLKTLIGVMLQDPKRIRVLLVYQLGERLVSLLTLPLAINVSCLQVEKLHKLNKAMHVDCNAARTALCTETAFQTILYAYFAYVTWSLVARLEAGDLGLGLAAAASPFAEQEPLELGRAPGILRLLGTLPSNADGATENGAGDADGASATRLSQGGPRAGLRSGLQPFAGAPQTLEDATRQSSPEPFAGTAYRLV